MYIIKNASLLKSSAQVEEVFKQKVLDERSRLSEADRLLLLRRFDIPYNAAMNNYKEEKIVDKVVSLARNLPKANIGPYFSYIAEVGYKNIEERQWHRYAKVWKEFIEKSPKQLLCFAYQSRAYQAIVDYFMFVCQQDDETFLHHIIQDPLFQPDKLLLLFVLGYNNIDLLFHARQVLAQVKHRIIKYEGYTKRYLTQWLKMVFYELCKLKMEEETIFDMLYSLPHDYFVATSDGLDLFLSWGDKERLLNFFIFQEHKISSIPSHESLYKRFIEEVVLKIAVWREPLIKNGDRIKQQLFCLLRVPDAQVFAADLMLVYFWLQDNNSRDLSRVLEVIKDKECYSVADDMSACVLLECCRNDDFSLMRGIAHKFPLHSCPTKALQVACSDIVSLAALKLAIFMTQSGLNEDRHRSVLLGRLLKFIEDNLTTIGTYQCATQHHYSLAKDRIITFLSSEEEANQE